MVEARRELLLRYGDLVASLGGSFFTSSDVNTGPEDMDVIGERTEHVFGRSEEHGGGGNPGPHTALGVYHGIRASLAHAFGSDDLNRSQRCWCKASATSARRSRHCCATQVPG